MMIAVKHYMTSGTLASALTDDVEACAEVIEALSAMSERDTQNLAFALSDTLADDKKRIRDWLNKLLELMT